MDPERWRRIEEVYHAAVERPAGERARHLAEACGADQELRAEVESLLAAGDAGDALLDASLDDLLSLVEDETPAAPPAPERAGPWAIEEAIGRGGMGDGVSRPSR